VFTFTAQDRFGRPIEEILKSINVVPKNNTGEFHVLSLSDNYPVLRGWLNAIRDYLVLDEYLLSNKNRVHLYRPNNPDRVSAGMGWVHEGAVKGTMRGTPFTKMQINGDVATVKLPTWRDAQQIAQVDIRTDWMFLKQRFAGEYVLSNAGLDDFSGECLASIKHNAILELIKGVAVTIPVTINVRHDGTLGMGLQNKAQKLMQEVQLLADGSVDRETLRLQSYQTKMAFRNERSIDGKIEAEAEYVEALPEEERPKPEPVAKTATIDGKPVDLDKVVGLFKVWAMGSNGKRMARPSVPFIRFSGANDARLRRYAKASYDLERLS
jgi:hypothetical protein